MASDDPGSGQTARLKRWLLWGGAGAALLGGLWAVIQFTGPAPRGQRGEQTVGEILLTGDSRQTSLEGLAAQLDTARGENAQLRQDVARLEGQIGKALEGVRQARFKPPTENGRAISGWARIPIPFELER